MSTRIVDAWNGWYHINGNTYGTWMRGDPRGWRSRHHREHVNGDYKHPPPPGSYAEERALSRALVSAPVHLALSARSVACAELVASLRHQGIEVIACAVDDHHFHLLARFVLPESESGAMRSTNAASTRTPKKPTGSSSRASRTRHQPIYAYIRHVVGLAKSRAARALSSGGQVQEGGVWAKRFKITPIASRAHQLTAFAYITAHTGRGATAWSIQECSRAPSARHAPLNTP